MTTTIMSMTSTITMTVTTNPTTSTTTTMTSMTPRVIKLPTEMMTNFGALVEWLKQTASIRENPGLILMESNFFPNSQWMS